MNTVVGGAAVSRSRVQGDYHKCKDLIQMGRDWLIDEIKKSGLRGRGAVHADGGGEENGLPGRGSMTEPPLARWCRLSFRPQVFLHAQEVRRPVCLSLSLTNRSGFAC